MKEIKVGHIYRHYRGDLYLVENIATHSETLEKYVVYIALYGENKVWIRPYDMFIEEVNKNGQRYRFELQNIETKNSHN